MDSDNLFGDRLNILRKERRLTVRELAKLSNVSQPFISNLIHGHRIAGEHAARKIATALMLQGKEIEEFVHLAINACSHRVLKSFKTYPSEVLNLVAGELHAVGILPHQIARCVRLPELNADTMLHLNDGKSARINVEVVIQ